MNTKQVEELVGVSRQNVRYYEKEGLLTPCREQGNSYRDYSQEDVERLKLIKMLRMLDMPLKDIALVLNNEVPLQDAVAVRQKELLEQQKRLQAAIDICNLIKKEKSSEIDVNKYLNKMEHMERNGNVFAKIIDDYKQAIREEEEKQIVFSVQDFFENEQDEYKIEWVIPNAQKNEMEPILLTLYPRCKSQEMTSHHGEEFGYVLKGSVTLVRGNKKYKLKAQETFYLDGSKGHYLYNHGNTDAKVLWITTPPMF